MRVPRALLGWALMGAGSVYAGTPQESFRVLAFYSEHTEGDHVDFARQANAFFRAQAVREHFGWDVTTNWDDLNAANLQRYREVVWLNDEPHTEAQRRAFETYMEAGGGWLGFHVSAYNDADSKWPWFVRFLGGAVFYGNNWPPLPADLMVEDRSNPMLQGFPESYRSPANEWYLWKPDPREDKDVRVLLSVKPSNYPIGLKDVITAGDLPVVWTNTRYRMLYVNMGHGDKVFDSTLQDKFFERAVLWVGREGDTPKK